MSVVARARKHSKLAVNLLWEEHAIAVKGQESVLALVEALEIEGVSDADCRTMIAVAPGNPITVVNPSNAWVVLIFRLYHLRVTSFEHDGFVIDVPVDTILTKSGKDIHLHGLVIAAENASKSVFKGYYGTVEDAV